MKSILMKTAKLLALPALLIPALLLVSAPPVAAEQIKGKATVIDGETLRVAGQTIRLLGIHAPKRGDKCTLKGRLIDCGHISATALMDLTAGAKVSCQIIATRKDGRLLGRCHAANYDLSEGMVHTGWARIASDARTRYRHVETAARTRQRGLWRGSWPKNLVAKADRRSSMD